MSVEVITTDTANEEGTAVFQCVFRDEDNNLVVPQTMTWTLTDIEGTVINSREDVAISPLNSTVYIVMSGDDLALQSGESGHQVERLLTLEGTYNSTYGNDLPLKEERLFYITNLTVVS